MSKQSSREYELEQIFINLEGFLEKINGFLGMPDCDLNPKMSAKGCLRLPTEA